MKRFALERSICSENTPPPCLHVMHVTPFVSSQKRIVQPGEQRLQQQQQQPGGDPGLAGDTRWRIQTLASVSHMAQQFSERADQEAFVVAGLPL